MITYRNLETENRKKLNHYFIVHPAVCLLAAFIGVPALVLIGVAAATSIITIPFAFAMGLL